DQSLAGSVRPRVSHVQSLAGDGQAYLRTSPAAALSHRAAAPRRSRLRLGPAVVGLSPECGAGSLRRRRVGRVGSGSRTHALALGETAGALHGGDQSPAWPRPVGAVTTRQPRSGTGALRAHDLE